MLFPKADLDNLVQIYDMYRIDASKSFTTGNQADITELNIYPDYTNNPATVFNLVSEGIECFYLDWAYETAGDYTIRVEMKTATLDKNIEYTVKAVSEAEDNLFATDAMIYSYEDELRRYLPNGRNSWKYIHRKAQEDILDYLYRNGILDDNDDKITKDQIIDTSQVEKWATFEAILLIYQDIKNTNSEAFADKLVDYGQKRDDARGRYILEYDSDRDGDIDEDDMAQTTKPRFFSR